VLARQRVYVCSGQAGIGKFTILYFALGYRDPRWMVNDADDPAVPPSERDTTMHGHERNRATAPVTTDVDAVTVRPMIAPIATATAKTNAPS